MPKAQAQPPLRTPRAALRRAAPADRADAQAQKDLPLIEDIRLLGRLLGEVIHEQEGRQEYEQIGRAHV